jgi:uncharacterized repeat protein (TIGR01451 family)
MKMLKGDPHKFGKLTSRQFSQRPIKRSPRTRVILVLSVFMAICLKSTLVMAAGTPSGTPLSSFATVTYMIRDIRYTQNSNLVITLVDEVIGVVVAWQDSADATVHPAGTNEVLTFRVTNTGNGTEAFALTVDNTVSGGEYTPVPRGIHLDTNENELFDADQDEPYTPGGNDPNLPPGGSITVFVLNDIPGGISNGDRGHSQLLATATTGPGIPGVPGSVIDAAGDEGTDVVLGPSGGQAGDTGTYLVATLSVSVVKSTQIADPRGGTDPITGAVLTYSLTVTVSGPGTAEGVIITDPIPENTTYSPGTLTLNSVPMTDTADTDKGDEGISTPGVVTVLLGDLHAGSPAQTIRFDVTLN